jgi:DNA-binding HxlR family transcriptional regulator
MTRRNVADGPLEPCPIRDVLDRIGDRWSLLVLWSLADGTLRFTELKRTIGDVSQRVLAQTLRRLEQDGFVLREIYPTVPPRVDYTLTDMGRSFLRPMNGLIDWADQYQGEIRKARMHYAGAKRNLPV